LIHDTCQTDPDLTRIADAWPTLAPALKAAMLAMIEVATSK
jgi:hypothetical protein